MMSVSAEFGSQLDPKHVLSQLVERTAELFDADHAAIFSRQPDGSFRIQVARNLSDEFQAVVEHATQLPISTMALAEERVVWVPNFPSDPRALEIRPALLREGINTLSVAPLVFRPRQARRPGAVPRSPVRVVRGGPGSLRASRPARRDRDPQRAELQPDGNLGGPAAVDPAARLAPDAAAVGGRDRPGTSVPSSTS